MIERVILARVLIHARGGGVMTSIEIKCLEDIIRSLLCTDYRVPIIGALGTYLKYESARPGTLLSTIIEYLLPT